MKSEALASFMRTTSHPGKRTSLMEGGIGQDSDSPFADAKIRVGDDFQVHDLPSVGTFRPCKEAPDPVPADNS